MIYDYECRKCGFQEIDRKAHPDDTSLPCPKCNGVMGRMLNTRFSINMGPCGAYGYYDDNLQAYVSTNKQRKALMEQQGVTEKGATPKTGGAWV